MYINIHILNISNYRFKLHDIRIRMICSPGAYKTDKRIEGEDRGC